MNPFILLIITLPFALSSECIPSLCPTKCCATKDTCASNQGQCNYCVPSICDSGCCIDSRCAVSEKDCLHSGNSTVLICLVVSIGTLIIVIFIMYKLTSRFADRARRGEAKEKVLVAVKVAPIVEVQTSPKFETEMEIIKEKEEKSVQGEKINNSVFIKHMKEEREVQEQLREEIYQYYEDRGKKPKKNEDKPKIEKKQEEEDYHEIILINAI